MPDKKEAAQVILTPVGRVINHSFFVLDTYTPPKGQPGTPSYKIEMAFPKGELDGLFDQCLDFANEKWGAGAENDVIIPIKDGDDMAKAREVIGKQGDAYKGMSVIRANTIFNKMGEKGPGGIQVLNLDTSEIGPANQGEVYQGCFGIAAIALSGYEKEITTEKGQEKRNAITFYLSAFQKTMEGDRLVEAKDHSGMFEPVGRAPAPDGNSGGSRRRRAG